MIILIANDLPAAARGRLKLWFIEPKPNVFVSGIKDSLAEKVVSFILSQKLGSGSLLFESINKAPGYRIHTFGISDRKIINVSGFQLIETSKIENSPPKF